jgi:CheY-like chemotaxis protein
MPRKDGYHTCREIRDWEKANNHPRVPIIALSANVMDDAIEKALKAGFDKFFSKPVNFVLLSQAMTELLGANSPAPLAQP